MAITQDDPKPVRTVGDFIARYWPVIAGVAALLYTGIVRDDRSQKAAVDFYAFAPAQIQVNQQNAVTEARLSVLIEDHDKRIKALEDRPK